MTSLAVGGADQPAHWGLRCAASIGSFGRDGGLHSSRTTQPGPPAIRWLWGRSIPESLERAVELVFPEEQADRLLRAAEEQDVAGGGVFSAGPGGVQVWSEPWNGEGGTSGGSVLLGSVEWTGQRPRPDLHHHPPLPGHPGRPGPRRRRGRPAAA